MKAKISIAKVASNPTVRFINAHVSDSMAKSDKINNGIAGIKTTKLTDNKTTYTFKKVWDDINEVFIFPPYVESDYVI